LIPIMDLELDDLKREFLAEAREKVREMESAFDGQRTPDSLARLAYLAHQLKGSGGSYGYQRISIDAAGIEKAVGQLVAGDGSAEPHLKQHVSDLGAEIDRCVSDLGGSTSS
jgi:HPt (histidine-containing phosphotransfer) domain-containing protein